MLCVPGERTGGVNPPWRRKAWCANTLGYLCTDEKVRNMARARMRASDWGLGWVWWAVLLGAGPLLAEEPVADFLSALRERGYSNEALQYLDRVEADPRTPADFRAEIAYQRGVTLVGAAFAARDRVVRERLLNSAKESLDRFLREQPDHPKRSSARYQFGRLLREWARMKVEHAARTDDASERKEAAALYDEAYKVFDGAVTELREQLTKARDAPEAAGPVVDDVQLRTLRNEYLDALLKRAETLEDKADTEPAGSEVRTQLLSEAARLYDEFYAKYSEKRYLSAPMARLNEARVWVKLGDREKALKCVEGDVIGWWSEPPKEHVERMLITKAHLLALDCRLHESRKEYAEAIARATPWLGQMLPSEESEPDWVSFRLQLAKAYRARAEELQAKDPRDPGIKAARDEARQLARRVARVPGGHQEEARALLASLPGGVAAAAARAVEKQPAGSFEEAKLNAVDAVAEMQSDEAVVKEGPGRLAMETDEAIKEQLRQDLAAAEQSVARHRAAAMENLLLALRLSNSQTPVDDLNLVRRLLAYLRYTQGEYYDAVVLGEFVGRKYPASEGAQLCAQIALAAYLKLYETDESDGKQFATGRIIALAKYILETWPGSPEASEAINALIPFLVSRGQVAEARAYVDSIPQDSPQRAAAELRIGESSWRDYLVGMEQVRQWEQEAQEPNAAADELNAKIAARKPELEALKQDALSILETGVDRMRKSDTVDSTIVPAALALAQIYVATDQAPKALQLLDEAKVGVLAMVQRQDPAVDKPELRERAYRVALSAVVSALPKVTSAEERAALIERSQQLMESLRAEVGDTPEAEQRLVEIFYSLARGLETQIQLLDRPEDRRVMCDGVRVFLEQVRAKSTDLRVLNWVAESYAGLGSGLMHDKGSADAAQACFVSAVETYEQIMRNATSLELTPTLLRHLQIRQALAQRSAGQYEEAIRGLAAVLTKDAGKLDVQVEAARTFQRWAAEPKQALKYKSAIYGAEPDSATGKNVIWGWNRIAQVTGTYKDYREIYYEARYNAADCYLRYASHMAKAADREKYLKFAKDSIVLTYRLNPKLGGPQWYAKYHALLKRVQTALNEPPVGLAESDAKKKPK